MFNNGKNAKTTITDNSQYFLAIPYVLVNALLLYMYQLTLNKQCVVAG